MKRRHFLVIDQASCDGAIATLGFVFPLNISRYQRAETNS